MTLKDLFKRPLEDIFSGDSFSSNTPEIKRTELQDWAFTELTKKE